MNRQNPNIPRREKKKKKKRKKAKQQWNKIKTILCKGPAKQERWVNGGFIENVMNATTFVSRDKMWATEEPWLYLILQWVHLRHERTLTTFDITVGTSTPQKNPGSIWYYSGYICTDSCVRLGSAWRQREVEVRVYAGRRSSMLWTSTANTMVNNRVLLLTTFGKKYIW